jgi:hypothetical protein
MSGMMWFWPSMLIQTALILAGALGAFQAAALCNGLDGLAWPFGLRHKRWGYLVAAMLMMCAFVGEAALALVDVELAPMWWILTLGVGGGLALLLVTVGASSRLAWIKLRRRRSARPGARVELGSLRATFHRPDADEPSTFPAVCLLPDPTAPGDDMSLLVQALVDRGIAVLALDWRSLKHSDRLALQGAVSVGVSHLAERADTDTEHMGMVGIGLGGDLALRSAAMDPHVAATLEIEPVLSRRRPVPGLAALCRLSWFEAQRRAHRWRRSSLVGELDGLAAIPRLVPRPVAIVVSAAGGPNDAGAVEILRVKDAYPFTPIAHPETVARAVQWLTEHLL